MNKNLKTTTVEDKQYIVYNNSTKEASDILYKDEIATYCEECVDIGDIERLEIFELHPTKLSVICNFQLKEE